MKRVIVAAQNTLVAEVVAYSMKKCDMLVEKALVGTPDGIADLCKSFFADVLVMDVIRFGSGSFDNRIKTAQKETTFTAVDKDVTVTAIYDVFAQQPVFERISDNKGSISVRLKNDASEFNAVRLIKSND